MRRFALIVVLALGSVASAAPLKIRNGSPVRVAVGAQRERGIGVRATAGGWRVEVGEGAERADLFDVTPGVSTKWTLPVESGALTLDDTRFVAGHVYRIEARRGLTAVGTALVYLYPAPQKSAAARHIVFDDAQQPDAPADDDGIAITAKSAL